MDIRYKIEFLSDWHCGSGLSSGADVDSLVIRDENELPFIPGKTIKGLLREACEQISEFNNQNNYPSNIEKCFGTETDKKTGDSNSGVCFFSNAEIEKQAQEFLNSEPRRKQMLFRKLSSTAINENGTAKEHSLRRTEVVIPMTLFGKISGIPDEESAEMIRKAMKFVKRLGENRNRGLGRCIISEVK